MHKKTIPFKMNFETVMQEQFVKSFNFFVTTFILILQCYYIDFTLLNNCCINTQNLFCTILAF